MELEIGKYYRIEYFDRNREFISYEVICANSHSDISLQNYPYAKIYRCNEKGNNYSGRLICTIIERYS